MWSPHNRDELHLLLLGKALANLSASFKYTLGGFRGRSGYPMQMQLSLLGATFLNCRITTRTDKDGVFRYEFINMEENLTQHRIKLDVYLMNHLY